MTAQLANPRAAQRAEVASERIDLGTALRMLASMAALGAGLVLLAQLVAYWSWWPVAGVGVGALAAGAIAWSLATLRASGPVLPRTTMTVGLVAVLGWVPVHLYALPFGPGTVKSAGLADAAAIGLLLVLVALVAVLHRRAGRGWVALGAGRLLLIAFLGVFALCGVTTAGLAATDAGAHAQPHFGHH